MKNIPLFTAENGVASLFLDQIPYGGPAYIRLLASNEPLTLLKECAAFCRACGAAACAATGDDRLREYPVYVRILEFCMALPETVGCDCSIFPVQEKTVSVWRKIYNEKMQGVSGTHLFCWGEERSIAASGDCYFVHSNGELTGILKAGGERIDVIASCRPGGGKAVLQAALSILTGTRAVVEVAEDNARAVQLYKQAGFYPVGEKECWYKIF